MGRLRTPWTSQPKFLTGLSSEFARPTFAFNAATGLVDIVANAAITKSNVTTKPSIAGVGLQTTATGTNDGIYTLSSLAADTTPFSVLIVVKIGAVSGNVGLFQWAGSTGATGSPHALIKNTTGNLQIYGSAVGYVATQTGVLTAGSVQSIVLTFDGTTAYLCRNGQVTSASGPWIGAGAVKTHAWFDNGFNTVDTGNAVYAGAIWSGKALPVAKALALSRNPWQLFQPLARNVYFGVPAAGGTYTASITDAIALAESASSQAALSASATESATLSHSQDAVIGRFSTIAEAMALVDTANRSFGSTGVASEAVAFDATHVAAYAATAVVSESMSLGDSKTCGYAAIATTTESMALADTGNGALAGGAFSAGISEAVTLSHTQAELYGATATASDGVSLADIGSNVAALGSTASDALTLDAIASSGGAFGAASVAALDLADARAAAMSAVSSATDAMALTDARVSQLALSAALITQILLAEIAAATNSGGGEVTVIAGSITRPARDQESTRTTRNQQSDRTRRVQSGTRPARIG